MSEEKSTCGLAIASLMLGIVGLIFYCISILPGLPAVVCGHLALSKIKRSGNTLDGRGMAIAGLSMGYIAIVFTVIVFSIGFIGGFKEEFTAAFEETYSELKPNAFLKKIDDSLTEHVSIEPSPTGNKRNIFNSSYLGFSIEVPTIWEYKHDVLYVTFSPVGLTMKHSPLRTFPNNTETYEYLMISYLQTKAGKSLNDHCDMLIRGTRAFAKVYNTSNRREQLIAGIRGLSFNDEIIQDTMKVNGTVYLVPYKDLVYTLSFRADPETFEKREQAWNAIAQTFHPQPKNLITK